MTGYNLPPGCEVCDIPGNRPQDELWDRLIEQIVCPECEHNNFCKFGTYEDYEECPILEQEFQSRMYGDR